MAAFVLDPVPFHDPDVGPMREEAGQPGDGDRLGRVVAAAAPVAKAAVGHLVGQALDGPLPGGVQIEGSFDERGAFGVRDDVGHLAPTDRFADVEVAEGCLVRVAAELGFLAHALADLAGQVGRVELGHQRVDAFDQAARGGLVQVLGHRDEGDPAAAQQSPDGDVVLHVAGQPVDLVDDDGLDVALLADPSQHGAQLRAGRPSVPTRPCPRTRRPAPNPRRGCGVRTPRVGRRWRTPLRSGPSRPAPWSRPVGRSRNASATSFANRSIRPPRFAQSKALGADFEGQGDECPGQRSQCLGRGRRVAGSLPTSRMAGDQVGRVPRMWGTGRPGDVLASRMAGVMRGTALGVTSCPTSFGPPTSRMVEALCRCGVPGVPGTSRSVLGVSAGRVAHWRPLSMRPSRSATSASESPSSGGSAGDCCVGTSSPSQSGQRAGPP